MLNINSDTKWQIVQIQNVQIIENNAHDHDHSSINTVHNKTTSVQSEECFTKDNINIDVLKGHDTLNEKSLKLASLNVCGLKRKVLFPEFGTLVNNYQIFSACETKLDCLVMFSSLSVGNKNIFERVGVLEFLLNNHYLHIFLK